MSQTWKITVAVIITAVVVGGVVYFWQANELTENWENNDSVVLTKEYLVSNGWGQEGRYGSWIKFYTDGTFDEGLAAETGDLPTSGSFIIKNNSVMLKTEKYIGLPFNEAKEKYGENAIYVPDQVLTLREFDNSLFFTHYLERNGIIRYWNRSSKVSEGSERMFDSYILITTQKDLKPKINSTVRSRPYDGSASYSFNSCDPTCETGAPHTLAEVYEGVLARTRFKGSVNGVEDYWYLVNIELPYYSVAKINNEIVNQAMDSLLAWIHGSELE
mgnify:CR=1 FL=1